MRDPADIPEAEHLHWEQLAEEGEVVRTAKGLHGLRTLAALREHPDPGDWVYVAGTGEARPRGQLGQ